MAQKCKAKNRKGKRCGNNVTPGMEVCAMHGGKTPRGMALPQFKTGKYSKYLPVRLQARYQEAIEDPELLSQRHEIALVDSRLSEVMLRVNTGESGKLWIELKEINKQIKEAKKAGDSSTAFALINELHSLIDKGHQDYRQWEEIIGLLESRRKLVESERKRLVELNQFITTEQATTLIAALLASVKQNVSDRKALEAIQEDFIRLSQR